MVLCATRRRRSRNAVNKALQRRDKTQITEDISELRAPKATCRDSIVARSVFRVNTLSHHEAVSRWGASREKEREREREREMLGGRGGNKILSLSRQTSLARVSRASYVRGSLTEKTTDGPGR